MQLRNNISPAQSVHALMDKKSHEALLDLSIYKTKKYRLAQELATRMAIKNLQQQHPEWRLKDTLTAIINEYPEDMPSELFAKMVYFIIEEWKKMTKKEPIAG